MIPHLSRRTKLGRAERDLAAERDARRRMVAAMETKDNVIGALEAQLADAKGKLDACRTALTNDRRALAVAMAERDALARRLADAEARLALIARPNIAGDYIRCATNAVCASMCSKAQALDHLLAEQSARDNGFTPDWAEAIPEGDAP